MTTTWDDVIQGPPASERLGRLLDRLRLIPPFGPVVTDEFKLGYSAARNDVVPLVDIEVTDLLGVYDVLNMASALFRPDRLGEFLSKPVPELDGVSPIDMIARGQASRVLELLAPEYEGQVT